MTFLSRRKQNSLNNVGDKMQHDMEEFEKRMKEGHHAPNVAKGSIGLSKYAAKQKAKRNGTWVPPNNHVEQEPIIEVHDDIPERRFAFSPFREAHYIFTPFSNPRRYINGLIVLNYLFLDSHGEGYRTAFNPEEVIPFDYVFNHLAQKPHCLKLTNETRVRREQNLYLDDKEREILLGDRYSPRESNLTLVQKLPALK